MVGRMPLITVLVMMLVSSALTTPLSVTELRPTDDFSLQPGVPVKFTFSPISVGHGDVLHKFRVWVWAFDSQKDAPALVDSGHIKGPVPMVQLEPLEPGLYRWGVQCWSDSGAVSSLAMSNLRVGLRDEMWQGVPWLGAADGGANEFSADVDGLGDNSGRVELHVAALGFGYVNLNGWISEDRLSPSGWTNTQKRVLFRTYDVTDLLNASRGGVLSVALGCGYRCDPNGRLPMYHDAANINASKTYDSIPKVFRLQLTSSKGTRLFHSGSPGWLQRQGPVTADSVYGGEVYEPHAVTQWIPTRALPEGAGPHGVMVPASFPGVRVTRRDAPVSIWSPVAGVHVVDFGSNVAGVCELSVPSSATVSIKHGELLQHAGLPGITPDPKRVYFDNLRTAEANDTLVLRDGGISSWSPHFTYHGFRYVEVHGYPGPLEAASIQRLRLNTAVEDKAHANFSDKVLQAIHLGAKGSQRSNLMQVPTDCPQRDERLGWMGDTSLSAESMLLHFDYGPMAAAFVDSMTDELADDGSLPDTVPWQRYGNRPADLSWSSAFLEVLWAMWHDGDITPSRIHWEHVKAHIGNLEQQLASRGGHIKDLREPYGDWCPPPHQKGGKDKEKASNGFAAGFSLVRTLQQAADLGQALGGAAAADGSRYRALSSKLGAEYHATFFNDSTQSYDTAVMLTYVLPLALGVTPESVRAGVVGNLLQHIAANNGTWTGGIINNRYLFDVLHENGHADVALAMLRRTEYPSYGYMYFNDLEPASECMWELPDAPFQGTGMNSRNHHMFSSVGHYLVTRVAGLTKVGDTLVEAFVGSSAGSASATLRTSFGAIAAFSWERSDGKRSLCKVSVDVPIGVSGDLYVPEDCGAVTLREEPSTLLVVGESFGLPRGVLSVKLVRRHGRSFTHVRLGSGKYSLLTEGQGALFV